MPTPSNKPTPNAYFGPSLARASERLRSTKSDVGKLERLRLPALTSEIELADWLGLSAKTLKLFAFDRTVDSRWHYRSYVLPKRAGGFRGILAPVPELRKLQRKVLDGILGCVLPSPAAHGFAKHRSIQSNAALHVGRQVVVGLDLKDFFPNISILRVCGMFCDLGYPFEVSARLALLCTEYTRVQEAGEAGPVYRAVGDRSLVQGAPTSPAIANLIVKKLDARLSGLAKRFGFTYSRYADDFTFSGENPESCSRLIRYVSQIVNDEGFEINDLKTRAHTRASRQVVTGLVVNDEVSAPRDLRRRLRAILCNASRTGLQSQNTANKRNYVAHLQGLIAHVEASNSAQGRKLRSALNQVLNSETFSSRAVATAKVSTSDG